MATHQDSSGSNPMSEAPKPETDFETWWRSLPDGPGYIGRHLAEYAWQAAHTALSARLAEVERERDELIGKLCLICGAASPCELSTHEMSPCTFDPSPIEAARAFLDRAEVAETALATAQGQLAQADAVIAYVNDDEVPWSEEMDDKTTLWLDEAKARHKARAAGKGTES